MDKTFTKNPEKKTPVLLLFTANNVKNTQILCPNAKSLMH